MRFRKMWPWFAGLVGILVALFALKGKAGSRFEW